MDIMEIKSKYDEMLPNYMQLENEANFSLSGEIKKAKIKIHDMPSRIKKFDSFCNKIESKNIANPFDDIHDIVGLRIVCLFRSDINRIGNIIRNLFCIISEDNKIEDYEISSFGYQSVHFIVKINDHYKGPRYDNIKNIKIEIQVRTIAMDAWASISHYLDYKTYIDVPKELRKDFYALSGLFYVADSHFEIFYNETQESRARAMRLIKSKKPEYDQEINLDTLSAYLKEKLPSRKHAEYAAISKLVSELSMAGYSKIAEIEDILNHKNINHFKLYEEKRYQMSPLRGERGPYFKDIGLVRGVISMVNENFLDLLDTSEEVKEDIRKFSHRE